MKQRFSVSTAKHGSFFNRILTQASINHEASNRQYLINHSGSDEDNEEYKSRSLFNREVSDVTII